MSVNGTTKRGWWVATLSAAMLLASAAGADDGPYVAADVGLAIAGDSDVRTRVDPGQFPPYDQLRGTLKYSPGWMIDGAFGWRISDYRIELNASYSDNQNDRLEIGPAGAPVPGGLQIVGAMVNAYYDMPLSDGIKPYIGGGLGAAYMTFESNTLTLGNGFYIDDNDTQLAWNIMAGVGFGLGDWIVLDVGYRFFMTANATFDGITIPAGMPTNLKSNVTRHDIKAGIRLGF